MKYKSNCLPSTIAAILLCISSGIKAEDLKHSKAEPAVTAEEAIKRLETGNALFVDNKLSHPHQDAARREAVAPAQHPFAIVLGCADSRVSPEVIFDAGLGDLFVVRVAGNVADDQTLGSIEYAVLHGAQLIVVLGHEECGAVAAAIKWTAAKNSAAASEIAPGHILSLVEAIKPAVEAKPGADAAAICKTNVLNVVKALQNSSPIIQDSVREKKVSVVGAYYNLHTGAVTFLDGHVCESCGHQL